MCSILIFRNGSWHSFSTIFCVWFFQKKNSFLMLYFINWPNFIVWLSLLLELFGNTHIAMVCFPGCDIINFEINPIFLIKPFFEEQNELLRGKKTFFTFKGLSVAKQFLRPESALLNASMLKSFMSQIISHFFSI